MYIYDRSEYDTPELITLRDKINAREKEFRRATVNHNKCQQEDRERYDQMLMALRPSLPSSAHMEGLRLIANLVHNRCDYGDHLGYPRGIDKERELVLPKGVNFDSTYSRINLYVGAPFLAQKPTQRAWKFTIEEIEMVRAALASHCLRIVSEWPHDDGWAFVVAHNPLK